MGQWWLPQAEGRKEFGVTASVNEFLFWDDENVLEPRLVWLSGLRVILQTERSPL